MKSKIVIILSSLIILMMCASVVSAAVENSGNDVITELNNGEKLIDTNIDLDFAPTGDEIYINLKDANGTGISNENLICTLEKDGDIVNEKTLKTDSNGDAVYTYKFTPGEYTFTCTFNGTTTYNSSCNTTTWTELIPTEFYVDVQPFGEKILSGQLVSDKGPLAKTPISVSLYNAKGEFIKDTPMITDENGLVSYDISKLPKGKYSAIFRFEGNDQYADTTSDNTPFTVDGKKPIHKKEKKDPKDVDMENTGAPIVALALGLLAVAGIGYRRY